MGQCTGKQSKQSDSTGAEQARPRQLPQANGRNPMCQEPIFDEPSSSTQFPQGDIMRRHHADAPFEFRRVKSCICHGSDIKSNFGSRVFKRRVKSDITDKKA